VAGSDDGLAELEAALDRVDVAVAGYERGTLRLRELGAMLQGVASLPVFAGQPTIRVALDELLARTYQLARANLPPEQERFYLLDAITTWRQVTSGEAA
jgi:hypothetical protein